MTFRNRFLFIIFTIICLIGLVYQWIEHNRSADEYDLPGQLSGIERTIDFMHVQRSCTCADWIEADRWKNRSGLQEEDYVFIEPSSPDLEPPASYRALADSNYALRLHGEFYKGLAIPYSYRKADPKPAKARVFYYDSLEVVKP